MKRAVVLVTIALLAWGGVVQATAPPKVTICHATESASNPWTRIVVDESAIGGHFDNPGTPKAGHEDDVLLQGEQDCPAPKDETPTPTPVPNPSPTPEPTPESGRPDPDKGTTSVAVQSWGK